MFHRLRSLVNILMVLHCLPFLVAKQEGSVVIGGISSDDGSGSTFGTLNIASGSLLFGGTHGATIAQDGGVLSVISKDGKSSFTNFLLKL